MQAECILGQGRKFEHKLEIEVKEKRKLESLLTHEQILEFQNGNLVAISSGQKLKLDDEVRGTVLLLAPLCGG